MIYWVQISYALYYEIFHRCTKIKHFIFIFYKWWPFIFVLLSRKPLILWKYFKTYPPKSLAGFFAFIHHTLNPWPVFLSLSCASLYQECESWLACLTTRCRGNRDRAEDSPILIIIPQGAPICALSCDNIPHNSEDLKYVDCRLVFSFRIYIYCFDAINQGYSEYFLIKIFRLIQLLLYY